MDHLWVRDAALAQNDIRDGILRGDRLRERLLRVPATDRDTWLDAALGLPPAPTDVALPAGAVPYLPCGVAQILAAVSEAPVRALDRFVDLGSGMGRVALLVHLLTGAAVTGIEVQAPLVALANERSLALGLGVAFAHADAAAQALSGSVFFLYAPFNGPLLERVLARVHEVPPPLTVCAVDLELREEWLRARRCTDLSLMFYDRV